MYIAVSSVTQATYYLPHILQVITRIVYQILHYFCLTSEFTTSIYVMNYFINRYIIFRIYQILVIFLCMYLKIIKKSLLHCQDFVSSIQCLTDSVVTVNVRFYFPSFEIIKLFYLKSYFAFPSSLCDIRVIMSTFRSYLPTYCISLVPLAHTYSSIVTFTAL